MDKKSDTLPLKIDSLRAVTVTASPRPHMTGDTLEYTVSNMSIPRNAVVEELLRRLPGLHIDPDGAITYNGEKIQHLLVDGEDIFGNDPSVVTRNFDASKIARVQILDRKSDDAIFTGIDDGTRTKTLNLVLKESSKNGYFGRMETGGNPNGYYNANTALAAFKGKEQLTALGIAANTGVVGFGSTNSSAAVSYLNGNADALGASAGTGIPRFDAAALHYSNTWPAPAGHLTTNYQYSHYYTQPVTSTQTLETLPGSVYGKEQLSESTNQQDQHWLYGIYDWAPNLRSAFRFTFHYSNSDGTNQFGSTGNSCFNDTVVNGSQRTIKDKTARMNLGGGVSWRAQLGKRSERVLSLGVSATKVDLATNGYLYSLNRFYQSNGTIQSNDTVDQRKQITNHNLNVGGSITYTEPLCQGAVLGASYVISHSVDQPLQATFDHGDGKYQQTVDSLTSHFRTDNVSQRATLNLQGRSGSLSYTLGGDWMGYSYSQQDLITGSTLQLRYSNWAPRLLMSYTPGKTSFYHFEYIAGTLQPSILQLTPAKNNNDPLHITLGNPNLKPGFNQNFKLDFHHLKTWLLNLTANLALVSNSISTKTITDSLGRQISQPINVDGGKTAAVNFMFGRRFLGFDFDLHALGTYQRTVSYIDADLSRNDAYTSGGGLSLNKYVQDKYSLQLSSNFTYFDQVSSINTSAPIRYWAHSHMAAATLYFIKEYQISSNAAYTWQQKTSAFAENTSVMLWNAYISRDLCRGKLVAKFQVNNILDANAGISRTNTANVNIQSSTNILGRYWMISATYHFDKKFKGK